MLKKYSSCNSEITVFILDKDEPLGIITKKSNIFVLREEYLQDFLDDMRNIMTYQESSEYLNDITIKTENTNITLA